MLRCLLGTHTRITVTAISTPFRKGVAGTNLPRGRATLGLTFGLNTSISKGQLEWHYQKLWFCVLARSKETNRSKKQVGKRPGVVFMEPHIYKTVATSYAVEQVAYCHTSSNDAGGQE